MTTLIDLLAPNIPIENKSKDCIAIGIEGINTLTCI